jgi:hypothetical protein
MEATSGQARSAAMHPGDFVAMPPYKQGICTLRIAYRKASTNTQSRWCALEREAGFWSNHVAGWPMLTPPMMRSMLRKTLDQAKTYQGT